MSYSGDEGYAPREFHRDSAFRETRGDVRVTSLVDPPSAAVLAAIPRPRADGGIVTLRRGCLGTRPDGSLCGRLTTGSRCPEHRAEQRAKYGGDWPARSKAAIAAHVAAHGYWCPGHKRDAHASTDLTLDHASGRVLCRGCNTRSRNLGDG